MPISLGRPSDHGFDQPLGLLSDCHRRIERFLGAMVAVAERSAGKELSAEHRDVVEQCRRYFATAGPRHTEDEELSLFPRLRASSSDRAHEALRAVDALESDHRQAEALHARVDAAFDRWLRESALSEDETRALREDLTALQAIYTRHIRVEDEELFPAAADVLSADDLKGIGEEMARRRR